MASSDFAILIHRALEPRLARLLELTLQPEWSKDAEALHQVRLASRRVRTVLELADPELYPRYRRHAKCLRSLTEALGMPRELDVHVARLQAIKESDPNPIQEAVVEHLQEKLDRRRRRQYRTMERELEDLSLDELAGLREDVLLPESDASPLLAQEVWDRLVLFAQPMEEALLPLLEQEEANALHGFRIHVKCLRYALEILESAFPAPMTEWLVRLKGLQTMLGDHHDFALLEHFLWEAHDGLSQRGRTMLAWGVLDIIGIVAEERRTKYEQFRAMGQQLSHLQMVSSLHRALAIPEEGQA